MSRTRLYAPPSALAMAVVRWWRNKLTQSGHDVRRASSCLLLLFNTINTWYQITDSHDIQSRSTINIFTSLQLPPVLIPFQPSKGWSSGMAMNAIRNFYAIRMMRILTRCWLYSGNRVFASSVVTPGWTMTSSPFFQLTGVVIRCLSPSWRANGRNQPSAEDVPMKLYNQ